MYTFAFCKEMSENINEDYIMINIKDIAKACNVSVATASRALRNTGYVSKEKRDLIHRVAKEHGYIVDSNAQNLKNGKSNTIGIIVSDIKNFFYNMVLENLIVEFKRFGYRVIISYSFENSLTERDCFQFLLSSKVDAIIFTPISNTNQDLVDISQKRDIPLLQLFRSAYPEIDSICVDDGYGAYLATKHLVAHSYRRIMLVSVKLPFTPNRSKGYKRALEEADIQVNEDLIQRFEIGNSIEAKLTELIDRLKPDAIIAGTNTFGLNAIEAMNSLGVNLPLVVFDNLDWLKLLGITTIAQPIKQIYEQTVENIMTKLESGKSSFEEAVNIKIKPELIVRRSTD
jgi:DNA-binding LacI/PurR family transcriptional regulator